jgi:hypothetical protein
VLTSVVCVSYFLLVNFEAAQLTQAAIAFLRISQDQFYKILSKVNAASTGKIDYAGNAEE